MRCFGQWAYDLLNSPSNVNTSTWALGLYSNNGNAEQPIDVDACRKDFNSFSFVTLDKTKFANGVLR